MALTSLELEDLVRAHPLPAGVVDCVMNRSELAAFFAVSMGTISAWLQAGMPVLTEGKQGQEYEFQASHCWAWKQARDTAEQKRSEAAEAAITAMRLNLVGGKPGDTELAMHPRERKLLYEVEHARSQMMRARNELLDRQEVREALENVFTIVRNAMDSFPDNVERVCAVDAKTVDKMVQLCDGLLETIHREIELFFNLRSVKERTRENLFDEA